MDLAYAIVLGGFTLAIALHFVLNSTPRHSHDR